MQYRRQRSRVADSGQARNEFVAAVDDSPEFWSAAE